MHVQVFRELSSASEGGTVAEHVAVACFLVREGADWSIKNKEGASPRELLPSGAASLISAYLDNQYVYQSDLDYVLRFFS